MLLAPCTQQEKKCAPDKQNTPCQKVFVTVRAIWRSRNLAFAPKSVISAARQDHVLHDERVNTYAYV